MYYISYQVFNLINCIKMYSCYCYVTFFYFYLENLTDMLCINDTIN